MAYASLTNNLLGRISFSAMLRFVTLVRTDVSEERSASSIGVTKRREDRASGVSYG
jgi:hypothetical protein